MTESNDWLEWMTERLSREEEDMLYKHQSPRSIRCIIECYEGQKPLRILLPTRIWGVSNESVSEVNIQRVSVAYARTRLTDFECFSCAASQTVGCTRSICHLKWLRWCHEIFHCFFQSLARKSFRQWFDGFLKHLLPLIYKDFDGMFWFMKLSIDSGLDEVTPPCAGIKVISDSEISSSILRRW